MKRYRVSAETLERLQGEHKGSPDSYGSTAVELDVEGVGFVAFPGEALVEVEVPLPPEPPLGSVVLANVPDWDAQSVVFQRSDDHSNGPGWYAVGVAERFEWARLCELGEPEVLLWAPPPEGSDE